jgi:hypothetical protein
VCLSISYTLGLLCSAIFLLLIPSINKPIKEKFHKFNKEIKEIEAKQKADKELKKQEQLDKNQKETHEHITEKLIPTLENNSTIENTHTSNINLETNNTFNTDPYGEYDILDGYETESHSACEDFSYETHNDTSYGAYEESYFINPKTGRFQLPKYKHLKEFKIKITDDTDYKEVWDDFDSYEKKEFTIKDFEYNFADILILEVEPFETIISKLTKTECEPYGYIKTHDIDVMSFVYYYQESEPTPLYLEHYQELLNDGFIEEYDNPNELKTTLYEDYTAEELKKIARDNSIKIGKNKTELIDNLIEANVIKEKKKFIPTSKCKEIIQHFYDIYINDIKENMRRFHPIYRNEIFTNVLPDTNADVLEFLTS